MCTLRTFSFLKSPLWITCLQSQVKPKVIKKLRFNFNDWHIYISSIFLKKPISLFSIHFYELFNIIYTYTYVLYFRFYEATIQDIIDCTARVLFSDYHQYATSHVDNLKELPTGIKRSADDSGDDGTNKYELHLK